MGDGRAHLTGVLAQYGATVIRVENAARMDTVRLLAPYWGGKAGRETSMAFGNINAGKLSVTLDPNREGPREVILDLVRWADVVTESFSPKAMKAWGLDQAHAAEPDLIVVSSCLFGQDGPYSLMAGYSTMEKRRSAAWCNPTGWPDQPQTRPLRGVHRCCARPISVAVLLRAPAPHRRGRYLDQSQIERRCTTWRRPSSTTRLTRAAWDRLGNDDPAVSPHGIYPSAGEDEWVAVAISDDEDWQALATLQGGPSGAARPTSGAPRPPRHGAPGRPRRSRRGPSTGPAHDTPRRRCRPPHPRPRRAARGVAPTRSWSTSITR
ncbi:MAG: CoA transferase [Acidimicrobiales bacterium]